MLLKNTASQGVYLFAWDAGNNVPKTGDNANITGSYSLDGAAAVAGFTTANPTSIGGGVYWQPLTATETNGNMAAYYWASSTGGIVIDPVFQATSGANLPTAVAGAAGGLFIAGSNAATTVNITGNITGTVSTVTTVTNQLTAAQIATGVWQDATAGDFTTASSIGKSLYTTGAVPGAAGGLFIAGSNAATTVNITGTLSTVTTVTNQLTAAAIATGVWQDSTAGDFTTASSIGKSLYIANVAPGAAGGHFIAGSNAATTVNITGNITGNLVGTVSTLTTYTGNTPQTGDAYLRLGAPAGVSIAADLAEIEADTDTLTTGVNVTKWAGNNVAWDNWWDGPIIGSVNADYYLAEQAVTAATSTTITLPASLGTQALQNYFVFVDTGDARVITDYDTATGIATVDHAWTITPTTDSLYWVLQSPISSGTDPWNTTIPASYASGKAGNLIGNALATINSKSFNRVIQYIAAATCGTLTEPLDRSSTTIKEINSSTTAITTTNSNDGATLTRTVSLTP